MFGRATIRLGIGPHSSSFSFYLCLCTISVYICLFLLVAIYVHVKGGQHDRRFPFLATWHFIAWQCQSVGLNLVFLVSVIFAVSPDVV